MGHVADDAPHDGRVGRYDRRFERADLRIAVVDAGHVHVGVGGKGVD